MPEVLGLTRSGIRDRLVNGLAQWEVKMESVGTYELKGNLSRLLERVEHGERITITRRGKPVAVLGPPPSDKPDVKKVIEEFKAFAKGRSLGGISIRELIDEGRRF
jgi:prevent-host-death family protein